MQVIVNPEKCEWAKLTARPQMERSTIGPRVAAILDAVRTEGDEALLRLTRDIDGVTLSSLAVTQDEIDEATQAISPELKAAIATAKHNIEQFHAAHRWRGYPDHAWSTLPAEGGSNPQCRALHSGRLRPALFNSTDVGHSGPHCGMQPNYTLLSPEQRG